MVAASRRRSDRAGGGRGAPQMVARKIVLALAGVTLVVAVAAVVGELVMRGWAVQQVDLVLSRPPFTKASHGAVTYSLLRGRVSVDALQAETSVPEIPALSAAHVDVDGVGILDLRAAGRDSLSLSSVAAEQLDLTVPGGHETFGALTARGVECTTLPSSDAAAKLFTFSAQRIDTQDFHAQHDETSQDVRMASFAIENFAMGPLRGHAMPASADAPPPTLAVASFAAEKIAVEEGGRSTSADRLEVAGLRLGGAMPPGNAPNAQWRAYLGRASVERLDAAQLAVALPNGESLHIDRVHTGALAAGRLDALEIDNLTADGNTAHFRLGAFALENLAYDLGELPQKPPRFFLGRLRVADLTGGPKPDAQITVQELVLTMDGTLEKRTGAALKVSGVQISAAAAPMLRLINYDKLSLEFDGRSSYDEKDGVVDSRSLIAVQEAGRLGVAMRLSNYPAAMSAPMVSNVLTHLRETRLDRFELRYEDASLADHLLKLYGGFSGRDAEGMRAQLIEQVTARRDAYPGNANVKHSLDTVIAFLRHPGAIAVRLAPPQPVQFDDLSKLFARGDLGAAADRLGLTIE
jgi:hypothetical protein